MAKIASPYFSFGARGTVGGSITAQALPQSTMLRGKPLPTDPYSLHQAYQRWLYEDYAYLWRQQSAATQAAYRSAGVRFHLTGFQYWMKDMLTRLPDIAGYWKLDDNRGATTIDSSRNANTLTILGASPITGPIDRCLWFDGVNDRLTAPYSPSLDITSPLSIELFFTTTQVANHFVLLAFSPLAGPNQYALWWDRFLGLSLLYWDGGANHFNYFAWVPVVNTLYHLLAQLTGTLVQYWINGVLGQSAPQVNAPVSNPASLFFIGQNYLSGARHSGLIDNICLRDRALDQPEILRHSLRRYPPQ